MVTRTVTFLVFLFISIASFGQLKELTLEDAVMQQYRAFYPKSLTMFKWIPNTDSYTYLDGYVKMMKASVKNTEAEEFLTIEQVNEKLGTDFFWFSGLDWVSDKEFWINDGIKYYSFQPASMSGEKIHVLPENAGNAKIHMGSKNISYTIENNVFITKADGSEIQVTNHKDKNIVAGDGYFARQEFGITEGMFWSPNGKGLAFYQKDESEVHDYPLLDINTTPGQLKSIKYPMAGQKSEKPKVGVYNLASGNLVYISPLHDEDGYLTNLSWTPDNKYVVIAEVNRGQDHMWLNVFNATTGEFVRTLFEEESETWVEPEHPAFFPLRSSNNFVWISERDGYNNLYYYDFNGKLLKKLTEHDFVVKGIMEFKNNQVYYTTTGERPLETQIYSVDLNGKTKILTRANGSHSVDISSNGKYFHDHFSSHTVASNDWIIGSNGKIVKKLMESPDMLTEYQMGEAEIGTIEAKDGTKLYTRLIRPSNFDPNKKYPVLVYVYGGPHAQLITNSWLDGASLWMYWLAEQGYLVYTVDNRGSAERGVAFESQIHRQLGTVEIEDQIKGVEYLKSLPYVDQDRLAVHGWSFGGFMTTSLMLRTPGVFTTGVAGGPVTDWEFYEVMYGERYMDLPEENKEGYELASLMTHAKKLQGKLLLIHGTIDNVVVMQHNLTLVQKFVELGKQMDFFPYPMHEHNVRGKDRVHLMEKVLTYIIENNK